MATLPETVQNGGEIFARESDDALYPNRTADRTGWRFVAQGDFVPLGGAFQLDNYVNWWGDNRIYFGT